MSADIKSYQDLIVWQKSMDLVENIYRLTAAFPKAELYGLVSQLRRAAVSIPSNLAEGSSRRAKGEFVRFVNIASGSLAEVETQLLLSQRMEFLTSVQYKPLRIQTAEISKMLFALQRSLLEKETT